MTITVTSSARQPVGRTDWL